MEFFQFYPGVDCIGYDFLYVEGKSVSELVQLALTIKKCVGFNTLGYLKYYVTAPENFKSLNLDTPENVGGIYVHKNRAIKLQTRILHGIYTQFTGYTFYPGLDSKDGDIGYRYTENLIKLKEFADKDPNCKGFNTLGYLKHTINPEREFISLPISEGLYVKNRKYRIRLLCNWCTSKELCEDWKRMAKNGYTWNNIEITWETENIDFYIIINKPSDNQYIPERTIVFQMEPWCDDPTQNWGVKTWGEWAKPDPKKFLQVRTHKTHVNNCAWQLDTTYNEFKKLSIIKQYNIISCISSDKYFDPGHIKRIDFLRFIGEKHDPIVSVHIYGQTNQHNLKGYLGPLTKNSKDYGIKPYKYYFMAENNREHNYITEKLWEPLLCESLCFYWGCPNIAEYIDPRAYIVLPLEDFELSFQIVKTAILNNEWEKRLEIIRREKQKVLEYYNFFPTVERIIGDLQLSVRI